MCNKPFLISLALIASILAGCDAGQGFDEERQFNEGQDPVVEDFPIVFVERPLPRNDEEDDPEMGVRAQNVLEPDAFNPGARLIFKARAAGDAPETVISDAAFASAPEEPEEPVDGEATPTPNPLVDAPMPSNYDVKDVSVSDDGLKFVFAMRAPAIPDLDEEEQPTWNIWEFDTETEMLRRIIVSDIIAESGEDISPSYLPNGDIIFVSNRQRRSRAILLDEGRPQFAATTEADDEQETFLIHSMDNEGLEITQLTFNQSHDLMPTVLDTGQVLFLRWDNFGRDGGDDAGNLSLYRMNPDGSDLTLQYGFHSPNTGSNESPGVFNRPIELPNNQVLVNLRPRETENLGGDLVSVDVANYIDINMPTSANAGATDPGQNSIAISTVITDSSAASPHGFFSSAFPLYDGTDRLIVSWTPCLVLGVRFGAYLSLDGTLIDDSGRPVSNAGNLLAEGDAPVTPAPEDINALPCTNGTLNLPEGVAVTLSEPQYGIWIYDPLEGTQSPVLIAEPNMMYTDVVALENKPLAAIIPPPNPDPNVDPIAAEEIQSLLDTNAGVLHIRSIYDIDGVDIAPNGIANLADPALSDPSTRPAYFVRFYKAVSLPDPDLFDLNINQADGIPGQTLKDIIGYAPIHPDGSVKIQLPADVALSFNIVDQDGRNIDGPLGDEHVNWINLRPGEVRECQGCHADGSELPHGRLDAMGPAANQGASGGAQFPNTQLALLNGDPITTVPEFGNSMAEFFYQQRLVEFLTTNDLNPDDSALMPSLDLVFEDFWTQPADAKVPSFAYRYIDLLTPSPVNLAGCVNEWNTLCRTVVSYPDHIQPLWDLARIVDVNGVATEATCINCHADADADGNPMVPAPGGDNQLNLLGIVMDDELFSVSYENLFRAQAIQELCPNNTLIDERRPATVADDSGEGEAFDVNDPTLLVTDDERLYLRELFEIEGVQQYLQEQLQVDGALQFEALDADGNIIAAPLDTPLELRMVDGAPVPFMVNALSNGDQIIRFVNQDACEIGGADPVVEEILLVDGDLIPLLTFRLDADGNMMPRRIATGDQSQRLFANDGARASQRFFDTFAENGPHPGYLNGAELKLISEWLDIGGQFYNNPFDTLED